MKKVSLITAVALIIIGGILVGLGAAEITTDSWIAGDANAVISPYGDLDIAIADYPPCSSVTFCISGDESVEISVADGVCKVIPHNCTLDEGAKAFFGHVKVYFDEYIKEEIALPHMDADAMLAHPVIVYDPCEIFDINDARIVSEADAYEWSDITDEYTERLDALEKRVEALEATSITILEANDWELCFQDTGSVMPIYKYTGGIMPVYEIPDCDPFFSDEVIKACTVE